MKRLLALLALILLLASPVYKFEGYVKVGQEFQQVAQNEITVYHAIGNIFRTYGVFTQPCEIICFVSWRGNIYVYTCYLANKVVIPAQLLQDDLKSQEEEVSDIFLVAHNHFGCPVFSEDDKDLYFWLKNKGFTGVFALWDSAQDRMVNRLPKK